MDLLEIGWFVGFISCFPGIDGDWIWLLGLFLGFGKNVKNKLLCSYEKIMKSKKKLQTELKTKNHMNGDLRSLNKNNKIRNP